MKLQRDGRTIKTWTDSGSKGFDILKTYYVTPGHDYQVVVTATVYNSSGKIVETPSAYSNEGFILTILSAQLIKPLVL